MHENLSSVIAKNLSTLRKEKGLTQGEIAERFHYSDKSISKWEKGESLPDIGVLKELAAFYEVSLDFLVTEHSEEALKEKAIDSPRSLLKEKLILTMLGICTVISIICIAEVILRINLSVSSWQSFELYFWLPAASFLTLIVFSQKWQWQRTKLVSAIFFVWLTCLALYLELGYDLGAKGWQCWFVLLIPIPITVGIFLTKGLRRASLE